MSGTSTPLSDSDSRVRVSRTVAIVKNHALEHRMAIEKKIEEAGFEIVKERRMEFDSNSDQDFLHELFGQDTLSLFEGAVWVYVLERKRAVQVFMTLMGDADPSLARVANPDSLRAQYGVDISLNAVMGSPSEEIAEEQIATLFQSSPPFLPQDDVDDLQQGLDELALGASASAGYDSGEGALSPSSSQLSRSLHLTSDGGSRGVLSSNGISTSTSTSNGANGKKSSFKARPVPKTNETPDIAPRTTRAAALRAGQDPILAKLDKPRVIPTKEQLKQAFMDVPGHKRSTTISVASTAAPAIAPRMSRAAALRMGIAVPTSPQRMQRSQSEKSTFDGVPGHKRRESIAVASTQRPQISPRANKSSELRIKKDNAPPSSFMFKAPSAPKLPGGLSRSSSTSGLSSASTSRPSSALASRPSASSMSRATSASSGMEIGISGIARPIGRRPSLSAANNNSNNGRALSQSVTSRSNGSDELSGSRSPPQRPPSIEPRTNRSAMLRAKVKGPTPPVTKMSVSARRASMVV